MDLIRITDRQSNVIDTLWEHVVRYGSDVNEQDLLIPKRHDARPDLAESEMFNKFDACGLRVVESQNGYQHDGMKIGM